jgi:hypothetical protein
MSVLILSKTNPFLTKIKDTAFFFYQKIYSLLCSSKSTLDIYHPKHKSHLMQAYINFAE